MANGTNFRPTRSLVQQRLLVRSDSGATQVYVSGPANVVINYSDKGRNPKRERFELRRGDYVDIRTIQVVDKDGDEGGGGRV